MTAPVRLPVEAEQLATVLVVPAMHCAGCMGKVERALRALRALGGVTNARVNLTARQVSIEHDASIAVPRLVDALSAAGFASQPRGA